MTSKTKWPMIADKTIKLRHMVDLEIGASVSIDTGRPIVTVRVGEGDCDAMTPTEARRVAVALVKAAECCDAKVAHAKAHATSMVNGEING